ncbi:hypothetical protein [Paenibacillus sp. y28]
MSEAWVHSVHGAYGTPPTMEKAVEGLRRKAFISFHLSRTSSGWIEA